MQLLHFVTPETRVLECFSLSFSEKIAVRKNLYLTLPGSSISGVSCCIFSINSA